MPERPGITPGKFRGASIQPVGPGRTQAQRPNVTGNSKKSGKLLRDLEETKLEGDPLYLFGTSTIENLIGDVPEINGLRSIGDRLVFHEETVSGTGVQGKVAIGVDSDQTLWFQCGGSIVSSDTEVHGFDWWCPGSSSSQLARRMRLTSSGKLVVGTMDPIDSAWVTLSGPLSLPWAVVSNGGTLTLTSTDHLVIGDATGGTCTVNLPAAADSEGVGYTIKRVNGGANDIVVDANGAETIDGAATKTLDSQYACIRVECDGTEWHITAQMGTVT